LLNIEHHITNLSLPIKHRRYWLLNQYQVENMKPTTKSSISNISPETKTLGYLVTSFFNASPLTLQDVKF